MALYVGIILTDKTIITRDVMAKLISAGDFATDGERQAAETLKQLPDNWIVICNKTLPGHRGGSYEVDFIVIGSRWIFVLDEKSWQGRIKGSDQEWVRADGTSQRSPLNKIDQIARLLAGHLRAKLPSLGKQSGHFVHGGILLSIGNRLPNIRDARLQDQVFLLNQVVQKLQNLDRNGGNSKIASLRQEIQTKLVDLSDRPQVPATIGIFTIEEVIASRPGVRILQARLDSGEPRHLMLYSIGNDFTQTATLKHFYLREYTAVQALHSTNLVADFRDPFEWSDDFLVVPIRPPEGKALSAYPEPDTRDDLVDELRLANTAFQGLSTIHTQGVLHRALGPSSIHVLKKKDQTMVTFTNFFAARIGDQTIAASLDELAFDDPYAAPELATGYGAATQASDVYSLALVFLVRLVGKPATDLRQGQDLGISGLHERWSSLPDDVLNELDALFRSILLTAADTNRPSADEIAKRCADLSRRLRVEVEVGTERLLDNRYRVYRILGQGSMARTYLALDTTFNVQVALKQFRNPSEVYEQARAEFLALQPVRSRYLPQVHEMYPPENDVHVKMEYIPGVTLRDVDAEFPWTFDRWWRFAEQLLEAIEELERHHLLHRDIKPENIMLHEQDGRAVLIDFGFAIARSRSDTQIAGTPRYLPPEALKDGAIHSSSDRYAAGVVFFRMLTNEWPFDLDDEHRSLAVDVVNSLDDEQQSLARVLLRVLDPDPEQRPRSVTELRIALTQARTALPEPDEIRDLPEQENPWVDNLRGLYRNSSTGNADNRGLDSPFVRDTYVPTALDTVLLPAILDKYPKAVFLSGNPGDGKTAFLEQVQHTLEQHGATRIQCDTSGWEWHLNNHIFRACYDASEAVAGQSADDQLTARLSGLEGRSEPETPLTVLVAINDGRLDDYFTRHKETFPWLAQHIESHQRRTTGHTSSVWIIDLKRRAFVQLPGSSESSVFQRVLGCLVVAQQWEVCSTCAAQHVCPMYNNAIALRDQETCNRLEYLFLLNHLRKQRHITMRDLRSTLAYIITGNTGCQQVHQARQQPDAGASLIGLAYWQSLFAPQERSDEMLLEIEALDPARFPQPQIDRFLHFHQDSVQADLRVRLFRNKTDLLPRRFSEPRHWIAAVKRRLYFESSSDQQTDSDPSSGVPRVNWRTLLPYHYADEFLALLTGTSDRQSLLQHLALGLLRSDAIYGQQSPGCLSVKVAASDEQQLIVLKQLPLEQFQVRVNQPLTVASIESIPETLIFEEQTTGTPRLELTIDLFDLLLRLADGLQPVMPELQPFLEDLMPFKSAVLLQSTRSLVLIENQSHVHFVTLEPGGKVVRRTPENEVYS
jgi:serine/threonine protein kinase